MSFSPELIEWKKPDLLERGRGVIDHSDGAVGMLKGSIDKKPVTEFDKEEKKAVTKVITMLRDLQKGNSEAMERKLNEPGTLAILRENNVPVEYVRSLLRDMSDVDHEELLNQVKNGNISKVPEAISWKVAGLNEGYHNLFLDLNRKLPEADIFDQQEIAQLSQEVWKAEKQTANLLTSISNIS